MVCLVVFPVNGCTCAGDNGMPCVISWCKDMVLESLLEVVKDENRMVKRKKHETEKKNIRSKKKKCHTCMDVAGTIFPDSHDLPKQLPYSECEGIYF